MSDEMSQREEQVELFKTVATFGFLSAAMFCLGGLAVLLFAPGLPKLFRHVLVVASGIAGFHIVGCVLTFYCLLARPTHAESADQQGEESAAREEGHRTS